MVHNKQAAIVNCLWRINGNRAAISCRYSLSIYERLTICNTYKIGSSKLDLICVFVHIVKKNDCWPTQPRCNNWNALNKRSTWISCVKRNDWCFFLSCKQDKHNTSTIGTRFNHLATQTLFKWVDKRRPNRRNLEINKHVCIHRVRIDKEIIGIECKSTKHPNIVPVADSPS